MRVEAEFGTGAKVSWNLQPPSLAIFGLDRKIKVGSWFKPAFGALRGMKSLRGTPIDPFGRDVIRRLERALREHYRELVEQACTALNADNYGDMVALVSLPDDIRGYEQVKLRNTADYTDNIRRAAAKAAITVPRLSEIDALVAEGRKHAQH